MKLREEWHLDYETTLTIYSQAANNKPKINNPIGKSDSIMHTKPSFNPS